MLKRQKNTNALLYLLFECMRDILQFKTEKSNKPFFQKIMKKNSKKFSSRERWSNWFDTFNDDSAQTIIERANASDPLTGSVTQIFRGWNELLNACFLRNVLDIMKLFIGEFPESVGRH